MNQEAKVSLTLVSDTLEVPLGAPRLVSALRASTLGRSAPSAAVWGFANTFFHHFRTFLAILELLRPNVKKVSEMSGQMSGSARQLTCFPIVLHHPHAVRII
jgi:hypothetical protein